MLKEGQGGTADQLESQIDHGRRPAGAGAARRPAHWRCRRGRAVGRPRGREGWSLGSHAWAELAQDPPGQERRGPSNVTVVVGTKVPCPRLVDPGLGLARASLWHLSQARRWETGHHIGDPVTG